MSSIGLNWIIYTYSNCSIPYSKYLGRSKFAQFFLGRTIVAALLGSHDDLIRGFLGRTMVAPILGSHYGLIVADQRALGRTMVWSEVFWVARFLGSHYGLIRGPWVARWSDQKAKSGKWSHQSGLGSRT